jgi:putative Ca2+/H+ antiporter (TMEM165/GDT1 family)
MAEYLIIVVVAFLAQLAVLPGEKVQFIIAGLSTRYHPLGVVAAAGAAFAGWTALEIWFGSALQAALPPVALDAFTAGLFLLFAVLLARSAPNPGQDVAAATDGGGIEAVEDVRVPVVEWEVPDALGGYLPIFVLMAAGEFGDKTQLVTIGLAARYGTTSAIWVGEMLAIIPVSLLNAYFFHRFSHLFDARKAHFVAAALFAFFGLDTVLATLTGFSIWETLVGAAADVVLAGL